MVNGSVVYDLLINVPTRTSLIDCLLMDELSCGCWLVIGLLGVDRF